MLISEHLFNAVSTWRRNTLAKAFIADNEEIILLLSAMNITPGEIVPVPCREGHNDIVAPEGEGGEECGVSLRLRTRCCSGSMLMSVDDCVQLLHFLCTRSCAVSSAGGIRVTGNREGDAQDEVAVASATCEGSKNIFDRLLLGLHAPSCWWRLGDIAGRALLSPTLSLTNSALVRHRCCAVAFKTLSTSGDGTHGDRDTAIDDANAHSVGQKGTLDELLQGSKLLLPRGTLPSFVRGNMLQPVIGWLRSLVSGQSTRLSSTTPEGMLRTLFGIRKKRGVEEEPHSSGKEHDDPGPDNDHLDLLPHVGLLITLFGYTVDQPPIRDVVGSDGGVCEDYKDYQGDALEQDISSACGPSTDPFCRFCGGRPPAVSSEPQGNESGGNARGINSSARSENDGGGGGDCDQVFTQRTIRWSEREQYSGHYESCPWKELFLNPVLKDDSSKVPSTDLTFMVSGADSPMLLLMCFKLHEVTRLMECWRMSVYTEFKLGEAYAKNPLPAAVEAVLPPPAEPMVEEFLRKLEAHHNSSDVIQMNSEENCTTLSGWFPFRHVVPLFSGNTFWNSYFRIASFVSVAALEMERDPSEPQRGVPAATGCSRGTLSATVSTSNSERNKCWKAAYDAGRRYIFSSDEGVDNSSGTAEAIAGELEVFTGLYRQNFQRDREAHQELVYSPSTSSAMDRLWQQLSARCSTCALHNEAKGAAEPYTSCLSAEDQARVHSLLESLERSIQNATRERVTPHSAQPTQPSPRGGAMETPSVSVGVLPQSQLQQAQETQPTVQTVSVVHAPPNQPQHQSWKQQWPQQNNPMAPPIILPRKPQAPTEGILPIPAASGGGNAILPQMTPAVLRPPQPKPQFAFAATHQGFPTFTGHGRDPIFASDSGGVLDDNYAQRPALLGQRRGGAGRYGTERTGGARNAQAGRGKKAPGRGGGGGRGAEGVFKY